MKAHGKKAITIVTGCLGSGKTTLLQHILKEPSINNNTAVIVNEYGKIGLDHHLLRQAEERTILLKGGCICCNSRADLEEELKELLYADESGESPFERVVIETTGMADPSPILFTILTNPLLQHRYIVDCVITTVDAKNGMLQLQNNPEIIKQITVADKIILTKTDICSPEEHDAILTHIQSLNPSCVIIPAVYGKVDPFIIQEASNVDRLKVIHSLPSPVTHPNSNVSSISFSFSQPLDWTAFGLWLSMLLHANGEKVMRVKGILDVGEDGPVVLNGVQHIIHPPQHLKQWPSHNRESYLIFIMRDIDTALIERSLKTFQQFLHTVATICELTTIY